MKMQENFYAYNNAVRIENLTLKKRLNLAITFTDSPTTAVFSSRLPTLYIML